MKGKILEGDETQGGALPDHMLLGRPSAQRGNAARGATFEADVAPKPIAKLSAKQKATNDVSLSRRNATETFEELLECLDLLEDESAEDILPLLNLRDRLELYLQTAPPGESFAVSEEDRKAAMVAAEILEELK